MNQSRRERAVAYLLISPGLILLAGVMVYPIISGFVLSFQRMDLASPLPAHFIGFKNYAAIFSDPFFLQAFGNTIVFVVVSIALQLVIGLSYALLLNQALRGRDVLRGVILLPWMMAPVVIGFVWAWLLDGSYGIINYALVKLHLISSGIAWLSSQQLALPTITLISTWQSTPFVSLVLLAGLQGIPDQLYEVATLDGAGPLQTLFRITIPLLKSAIMLALLMRTMMAMQYFDVIWVTTRGGPGGATEVLGTYAYKQTLLGFRMGYGASITTVIFLLSLVFSIVYLRVLLGRKDNES